MLGAARSKKGHMCIFHELAAELALLFFSPPHTHHTKSWRPLGTRELTNVNVVPVGREGKRLVISVFQKVFPREVLIF